MFWLLIRVMARLQVPQRVTLLEALAVLAAGFAAGGVNTIVGSGSLITFPTLLAVGYPSVVANVSNSVGLVPGGISGAIGYRRELEGQWRRRRHPRDRHDASARSSAASCCSSCRRRCSTPSSRS